MSVVSVPAFSIVPSSVTCTAVPLPTRPPQSSISPPPCIASSDRDLLDYMLEPALQHGPVVRPEPPTDDELGPPGPAIVPSTLDCLTKLQAQGIAAAEEERYDAALALFTDMIQLCPQYAAAYNNRAQTLLLLHRSAEAQADLDLAIAHAHRDRVTLRQAHTQRGLIHRAAGRDADAKADFTIAARLGSAVAKQQLIALNPYSALCNAVLSRAMQQLTEPEQAAAPRTTEARCV